MRTDSLFQQEKRQNIRHACDFILQIILNVMYFYGGEKLESFHGRTILFRKRGFSSKITEVSLGNSDYRTFSHSDNGRYGSNLISVECYTVEEFIIDRTQFFSRLRL